MSFIKDRLENVSRSVGMHAAGYYDASARRGWLARKGELLGEETRANGLMFALADCVSVVCLQELPCETMEWAFADRGIAARVLEPRDLVAVIYEAGASEDSISEALTAISEISFHSEN